MHCRSRRYTDNRGYEADDIYDFTGIEWAAECVDEEQLEPSAYGDDAWNHTIKYGYYHQE